MENVVRYSVCTCSVPTSKCLTISNNIKLTLTLVAFLYIQIDQAASTTSTSKMSAKKVSPAKSKTKPVADMVNNFECVYVLNH